MTVNAIAAVPGSSELLLATPSSDGSLGNSVVTLNSDTGQIQNSTFVGSEPSILAPTPDGSAVYAYLSGQYSVARLNLGANSPDLVFTPDPNGGTNQYGLFDMKVGPDDGLAVSYSGDNPVGPTASAIPVGGTIAIFDNGVVRPQIDSNSQGPLPNSEAPFSLAFNASGSLLYGYNSSSTQLKRDAVSPQGLTWLSTAEGLIMGYATIQYAQGLLYASNGTVVDPEQSLVVGQFVDPWLQQEYGAVAPDVAGGRVYFATPSGILIFDSNSFALLGRLPLSLGSNTVIPQALVRVGANDLALLNSNGQLYLVSIPAIPLLTPFFSGEQALGLNMYYLQLSDGNPFGFYQFVPGTESTTGTWLNHFDLGYEYATGQDGSGNIYFYDSTSGHWWYTSSALFPYLYDFSLKTWIYCFPNTNNPGHYTSNPRYFANLTTGQIFTM